MKENSRRIQTLEAENKAVRAENKELQTKVEKLMTSTTLPPGFAHVHYEINTNLTSVPEQTIAAMLTSSARYPICELRLAAVGQNQATPVHDLTLEPIMVDPSEQTLTMSTAVPTTPDAVQVHQMQYQLGSGLPIDPNGNGSL
ncbi:hypothetical protein ACOSQ3_006753 [Xanthoceras sorbifolium]